MIKNLTSLFFFACILCACQRPIQNAVQETAAEPTLLQTDDPAVIHEAEKQEHVDLPAPIQTIEIEEIQSAPIKLAMITNEDVKIITGGIADTFGDADGGVVHLALTNAAPKYAAHEPEPIPNASVVIRGSRNSSISSGTLTAGEINDFQKWKLWGDLGAGELNAYRQRWKIEPNERYCIVVRNRYHSALPNVQVTLMDENNLAIWETITDASGKAECWNAFDRSDRASRPHHITLSYAGLHQELKNPIRIEQGLNLAELPIECEEIQDVDIHFAVDATGSMGDEIEYLQAELADVMQQVKSRHSDWRIELGATFYRDYGDTYVTKSKRSTDNLQDVYQFIDEQYADGGGDGPEAVHEALEAALSKHAWHDKARARLLFLILDAPPHDDSLTVARLQQSIRSAASKGIKIVPVVASGGGFDQDKSLEYIMRCCALGTNGTYTFLTDDSGVGGAHTAPSTDHIEVEKLNAMLIRLIESNANTSNCNDIHSMMVFTPVDTMAIDSTELTSHTVTPPVPQDSLLTMPWTLRCYPNPAVSYIWGACDLTPDVFYIADSQGKLLLRIEPTLSNYSFPLDGFPTGTYLMIAERGTERKTARFVVTNQ